MGDIWEVWATIWRRFFDNQTAPNNAHNEGFWHHNVEGYSAVMHMYKGSEKNVPNRLKYFREKLAVTQQEMEWRTGVGNRSWPHYETGIREPKIKLAQKFAQVFNEIANEKGIEINRITTDDLYPIG